MNYTVKKLVIVTTSVSICSIFIWQVFFLDHISALNKQIAKRQTVVMKESNIKNLVLIHDEKDDPGHNHKKKPAKPNRQKDVTKRRSNRDTELIHEEKDSPRHDFKQPLPYHWINTCDCNLGDKVKQFGQVLSTKRHQMKDNELIKAPPSHDQYQDYSTLFEWDEAFFRQVLSMPGSEIYFLPWTLGIDTWRGMESNEKEKVVFHVLPVKEYHPTFLTKSISQRFRFKNIGKASALIPASVALPAPNTTATGQHKLNTYMFNYHGMSPHKPRSPGELDYFGGWNTSKDCHTHPCSGFPDMMTFLILLKGQKYKISLGPTGRVYIPDTRQNLIMSSCYQNRDPPELFGKSVAFDKVFYITQNKAGGTYHGLAEMLTKLALFVPFLKQNPDIRILLTVNSYSELLLPIMVDMYQLRNKIVLHKNHFVLANIVYVPPGMHCFRGGDITGLQMTSQHFHKWTEKSLSRNETRNLVVILRRSTTRHLQNYAQVYGVVQSYVESMGGKVLLYEFNDEHLPSVRETIQLFYRALVVVGVHGAGLTNMIFSQPGTHVVELHCTYVNPTFKELAYKLGMYYYPVVTGKISGACHREGPLVDLDEVHTVMSVAFQTIKSQKT